MTGAGKEHLSSSCRPGPRRHTRPSTSDRQAPHPTNTRKCGYNRRRRGLGSRGSCTLPARHKNRDHNSSRFNSSSCGSFAPKSISSPLSSRDGSLSRCTVNTAMPAAGAVCCAPSMQPPQRMHIASCYEAVLWL